MTGDFGQSQVISEREHSYWLFIQRRQLSITRKLRSNGQNRQRRSNMNQYSVTVMPISLLLYCLAVKWESLLRLVGGAWYFLSLSQHGCHISNFLMLQLNSTLYATAGTETARLQLSSDWFFSSGLWNQIADAIRSTGGHKGTSFRLPVSCTTVRI